MSEEALEAKEKAPPEFYRDLVQDANLEMLWHFTHRHSPETGKKPVRTPDGKPHAVPLDWGQIFPDAGKRLEIEVGSGRAAFLAEYALKHPEVRILGSEWDYTWAVFGTRRLQKRGITNAAMLRGDIFYFLRDRVKSDTVDAFHMYFPDPWPKERHHKNRLLKPEFLAEVARTLKPGRRTFYWATDHKEYNEVALDIFDGFPGCTITERNSAAPTEGIMTGFEVKYRKEGRPIYRSVAIFEK